MLPRILVILGLFSLAGCASSPPTKAEVAPHPVASVHSDDTPPPPGAVDALGVQLLAEGWTVDTVAETAVVHPGDPTMNELVLLARASSAAQATEVVEALVPADAGYTLVESRALEHESGVTFVRGLVRGGLPPARVRAIVASASGGVDVRATSPLAGQPGCEDDLDVDGPTIVLESPRRGDAVTAKTQVVVRATDRSKVKSVLVNARPATLLNGRWRMELGSRAKEILVEAVDDLGNQSKLTFSLGAEARAQTRRDFAILVATDRYENGWDKLDNPIRDAEALRDTLRDVYGFDEILLLPNVGRAELARRMAAFREKWEFGPHDQLLVFVAGHGYRVEGRTMHLILRDAPAPEAVKWTGAYTVDEFLSDVRGIGIAHTLVVLDVCRAGSIFTRHRGAAATTKPRKLKRSDANFIARALRHRSFVALTSGGDEYVPDGGRLGHSPFTAALLRVLRSYEGKNEVLTFARIRAELTGDPSLTPTPVSGVLPGHEPSGEFLLIPAATTRQANR